MKQTAADGKSIADLISKGTSSKNISQWLSSGNCDGFENNGYSVFFWADKIAVASPYDGGYSFVGGCSLSNLFGKQQTIYNNNARIRPVITLNSNVKLSGNSTDGWTIQ